MSLTYYVAMPVVHNEDGVAQVRRWIVRWYGFHSRSAGRIAASTVGGGFCESNRFYRGRR